MPGFARFGAPTKPLAPIVGVALALIAAWVVLSHLDASLPYTNNREVLENVSQQLRSGAAILDMGQAADFPWDEVFVFSPYYPKDDICKSLKLTPSRCSAAHIRDVDEAEFFLVFMQKGEISSTVRLPRAIANFEERDRCVATAIPRGVAVFTVERRDSVVYLVCR
jgi:hypothetical protein